jgi:RNA polymerase sigma factor (sigma-70 family)
VEVDTKLVKKVKDSRCSEAIVALAERHVGIFNKVYKKYFKPLNEAGYAYKNFQDDINLIVFKACSSFKEDGGSKFSTWLCNHARYFCLNEINDKNKKNKIKLDLNYFFDDKADSVLSEDLDATSHEKRIKDEADYVMNILSEMKDKRIKKVFGMRYFSETRKSKLAWSEIGRQLGISTQTAINLHDKGAKMVRNKIESNCNSDKI